MEDVEGVDLELPDSCRLALGSILSWVVGYDGVGARWEVWRYGVGSESTEVLKGG